MFLKLGLHSTKLCSRSTFNQSVSLSPGILIWRALLSVLSPLLSSFSLCCYISVSVSISCGLISTQVIILSKSEVFSSLYRYRLWNDTFLIKPLLLSRVSCDLLILHLIAIGRWSEDFWGECTPANSPFLCLTWIPSPSFAHTEDGSQNYEIIIISAILYSHWGQGNRGWDNQRNHQNCSALETKKAHHKTKFKR